MPETAAGRAKRFLHDRGFGFIAREDGPDLFLHASVLVRQGLEPPEYGSWVTVEFEEVARGLSVTRIIDIEPPTETDTLDQPEAVGEVLAARVKFYDWARGYGFATVFGRPDQDVYLHGRLFRLWKAPPADGEAIGIRMVDDPSRPRAAEVHDWSACVEKEASA